MKKTSKFLAAFVYSNLLIALGSVAICVQVFFINELDFNYFYWIFVFSSTFVSYNLQRLIRIKEIQIFNPKSWVFLHTKLLWFLTGVATFVALFSLSHFWTISILIWLVPVAIISLLYSYKGLRNIPYLKIFLISISWGIVCGILPFVVANEIDLNTILLNFSLVFLYIFSITIPFDIRDKGLDEDNKRTIPQVVGVKNAKITSLISLGIYLIISVYLFPFYTLPFLLSVISAGGLIYFSDEKRNNLYYSFWIDGHILFQFFAIMLIYFTKYA